MKPTYNDIADIARHCDKTKLKIAETQAFEYDLKEELCDIWDEVWIGDDSGSGDLDDDMLQVLKIWGLFSYSRYVENSIYTDTGSGLVRKDHSNSFPVQLNEIKTVGRQYRDMALIEVKRLKESFCKENKPKSCVCDGACKRTNGETKLFPRRGKNLNRYDLL